MPGSLGQPAMRVGKAGFQQDCVQSRCLLENLPDTPVWSGVGDQRHSAVLIFTQEAECRDHMIERDGCDGDAVQPDGGFRLQRVQLQKRCFFL